MSYEFKVFIFEQLPYIIQFAGDQIIQTNNLKTFNYQSVTKMRTDEPSASRDHYCFFRHFLITDYTDYVTDFTVVVTGYTDGVIDYTEGYQ
jgi:hypothetical protein